MQITIDHVYPSFFNGQQGEGSQIWKQQLPLDKGVHTHIVAPSGSGKTSLIHFLYGLKQDYSGTIRYNDADIKQFDATKFATWRQQHISIVFQDLRLFPEQTVLQNLW